MSRKKDMTKEQMSKEEIFEELLKVREELKIFDSMGIHHQLKNRQKYDENQRKELDLMKAYMEV